MMHTPEMLWKQYHQAVRENNQTLAQAILTKIQGIKNYPSQGGGCPSCNRRLR